MERNQINGPISPSGFAGSGGIVKSVGRSLRPNYSGLAVQEALEHLASVDLIELCSEAKVERCRATRDLRSCGRYVQYVLNSCGHASLCSECSQRCDVCPVCRISIPKNGNGLRLRLYYECIEAGLISRRCYERFQEKEDGDSQLTADVQRLYSLFDVALENNLVSLICHYVTDVCMDESAVSSDPVIAFLLDEVVVKDWCKWTFRNIIVQLQEIYNVEAEEMKTSLNILPKLSVHLAGVSNVLEVLESSFKSSLSAQLDDLQFLQESIIKTKQHLEIMRWCMRHQFLESVRSRYADFMVWRSVVHERKSAAIKRSWPDVVNQPAESSSQPGSLFIEDALANLEIGRGHVQEMGEESELASLQKDKGSFFGSKIERMVGCYPFGSLRSAVDVLFLCGSSNLVVAKQAILLYYLIDRHWTMPDETWRHIVDDFAATFGITRHSLLESLTFYLLDDHTDEALRVVCDLLPEISGPSTHPKIAQVLLEREIPETALMVLRWSGRDGPQIVSLSEAVTAVRVRVQCGLLTEAFMLQRMLCTKVRERDLRGGPPGYNFDDLKGECRKCEDWLEILVTEICCLCIRSNLVDRVIELPWNLDEEKYLHKCLLDCAVHDPSTTTGSLLVVFYLQRYRYAEAYQVDLKLQSVEKDFISKNSSTEEVQSKMRSASHWRAELVVKSIELLPQVQQQQVKTGKLLPQIYNTSDEEVEKPAKSELSMVQEPMTSTLLASMSVDSSLVLQTNHLTPIVPPQETPSRLGASINNPPFELGKYGPPPVLHERLFQNVERRLKPQFAINKNFKYNGVPPSKFDRVTPMNSTPLKDITRTSLKVLQNSHLQRNQFDKSSPEREQNGFAKQVRDASSPYSHGVTADPAALSGGNHGFPSDSAHFPLSNVSSKRVHSSRDDVSWGVTSGDGPMDIVWSGGEKVFAADVRNVNGGPRWRSDETSDGEEEGSLERVVGVAPYTTPTRGNRRSRFVRK